MKREMRMEQGVINWKTGEVEYIDPNSPAGMKRLREILCDAIEVMGADVAREGTKEDREAYEGLLYTAADAGLCVQPADSASADDRPAGDEGAR
jgi:hypothetical protein